MNDESWNDLFIKNAEDNFTQQVLVFSLVSYILRTCDHTLKLISHLRNGLSENM